MTHLLPAQFSAWVFNGFQPAYEISVNKNIWLSASALATHGPCAQHKAPWLSSTKQQNENIQTLENENSKVPRSQAFVRTL